MLSCHQLALGRILYFNPCRQIPLDAFAAQCSIREFLGLLQLWELLDEFFQLLRLHHKLLELLELFLCLAYGFEAIDTTLSSYSLKRAKS